MATKFYFTSVTHAISGETWSHEKSLDPATPPGPGSAGSTSVAVSALSTVNLAHHWQSTIAVHNSVTWPTSGWATSYEVSAAGSSLTWNVSLQRYSNTDISRAVLGVASGVSGTGIKTHSGLSWATVNDNGSDAATDELSFDIGLLANTNMMSSESLVIEHGETDGYVENAGLVQGAAPTNLVVADASHAHAADNVVLTQVHSVVVADATHAHAGDNVALTQQHSITVADALHGHTADEVALTVVTDLVVADASHAHTADAVVLTQVHNVTVADASHAHAGDNVALTQAHSVVVADALHDHTVENVTITVVTDLVVQDSSHAHSVDSVALSQVHVLTLQDATSAHTADNVALTQVHNLTVADATHGHTADNVVVTTQAELVIADALHGHSVDNVSLTQVHVLAVDGADHGHTADSCNVTEQEAPNSDLLVADGFHLHPTDEVVLTQVHTLVINSTRHFHEAESSIRLAQYRTAYILVQPTADEWRAQQYNAIDRVGWNQGLTLYRVAGIWNVTRNPFHRDLEDADLVYPGGYQHEITDASVRTELATAGYGFTTEQRLVE